jgi:hypothetical protein
MPDDGVRQVRRFQLRDFGRRDFGRLEFGSQGGLATIEMLRLRGADDGRSHERLLRDPGQRDLRSYPKASLAV